MPSHADITFQNNQFHLAGELTFFNVMSVYQKSLPYLNQCSTIHFDFSGVTASDSGGLALIIEWIKFAKKHDKPISFSRLSHDLLSIAKAADLDQFIITSEPTSIHA